MITFKQFLTEQDQNQFLYVYDSQTGEVTELDTLDQLAMQRFNNHYGFHSDSLWDIPEERGVRVFTSKGNTVVVGSDPVAIAAEVEMLSNE